MNRFMRLWRYHNLGENLPIINALSHSLDRLLTFAGRVPSSWFRGDGRHTTVVGVSRDQNSGSTDRPQLDPVACPDAMGALRGECAKSPQIEENLLRLLYLDQAVFLHLSVNL